MVLLANGINPVDFEGVTIYESVGCPKCNGTGHKGRGAIMEVLPISDAVRAEVVKGSPSSVIRDVAIREGMVPLKQVGLIKVREGLTSLNGALQVTGSE